MNYFPLICIQYLKIIKLILIGLCWLVFVNGYSLASVLSVGNFFTIIFIISLLMGILVSRGE